MATFRYIARAADQSLVEGMLEADDVKAVIALLEEQGLSIESVQRADLVKSPAGTSPSLAANQVVVTERHRQLLTDCGPLLIPALAAYAEELTRGPQRRKLRRLIQHLESFQGGADVRDSVVGDVSATGVTSKINESRFGVEATELMGPSDYLWPSLLKSAATGDASCVLRAMMDDTRWSQEIEGRLTRLCVYPLIVLAVLLVVVTGLSWWVTPVFQDIFTDFGIELPGATAFLLRSAMIVRATRGWVLCLPAVVFAVVVVYLNYGGANRRLRFLSRIPWIGAVIESSERSKLLRNLADLLEAREPVVDALKACGRVTPLAALWREVDAIAEFLRLPDVALSSMPISDGFPRTALHAIELRGQPEASAKLLREVAAIVEDRTRDQASKASRCLEPITIILLGLIIGFYVISMMMPLVSLVQNLT